MAAGPTILLDEKGTFPDRHLVAGSLLMADLGDPACRPPKMQRPEDPV